MLFLAPKGEHSIGDGHFDVILRHSRKLGMNIDVTSIFRNIDSRHIRCRRLPSIAITIKIFEKAAHIFRKESDASMRACNNSIHRFHSFLINNIMKHEIPIRNYRAKVFSLFIGDFERKVRKQSQSMP